MFEFNTHPPVVTEVQGSSVYIIDDFYKHPKEIENLFWSNELKYHKEGDPGGNGKLFHDMRHQFYHEELWEVGEYLLDICGAKYHGSGCDCLSNVFEYEGTDYINNYWYPHLDAGYTALIYFQGTGTNLYAPPSESEFYDLHKNQEHVKPWRSKEEYKVLLTMESKYNRLVLFDGKQFYHGADITHSPIKRFNQVIFFTDEP
tara:strand:+ start:2383 stop:2988 length:606 start_codon:yes stop_codon:yes gene_type:complete